VNLEKMKLAALVIAAGPMKAKETSISVLSILTIGNFEKLLTKICKKLKS
jgi:hypothetical protein